VLRVTKKEEDLVQCCPKDQEAPIQHGLIIVLTALPSHTNFNRIDENCMTVNSKVDRTI